MTMTVHSTTRINPFELLCSFSFFRKQCPYFRSVGECFNSSDKEFAFGSESCHMIAWFIQQFPLTYPVYFVIINLYTSRKCFWKAESIAGFLVYKCRIVYRVYSEFVYEALACWGVFPNNQRKTCSGQISAPFRNRNTPILACDVAHPFPVLCGHRRTALFFRGLRILAEACSA